MVVAVVLMMLTQTHKRHHHHHRPTDRPTRSTRYIKDEMERLIRVDAAERERIKRRKDIPPTPLHPLYIYIYVEGGDDLSVADDVAFFSRNYRI